MGVRAKTATVLCVTALCAGLTAPAVAESSRAAPVVPGTASQISALVEAAPTITSIPVSPLPSLAAEPGDSTSFEYPIVNHCINRATDPCVFGKTKASRKIVLFGDSHAYMWLPAVAAAGKALGYKVLLIWAPGCPAASVTPWFAEAYNQIPAGYDTPCATWRTRTIVNLKRMHPALILLSSRTDGVMSGPGTYFTDAQWQAGLKTTVRALKSSRTKVGVIGDILPMPGVPEDCLAAHPSAVQTCAQSDPDPAAHGHESAEKAEAAILKIGYISTVQWLCTTKCSPVIGNFLPYLDAAHLDETYVNYLSGVMTAAIKAIV